MATAKSQRIGVWIITIVLALGTLGSFLAAGLSVQNQSIDSANAQKSYEEYLKQAEEEQAARSKANAASSEPLEGYSTSVFDANTVTELKVETLVEGSGETVKETDGINVSYFGWLSDGTIFDSSKKKDTADAPIDLSLNEVIEGWTKGLAGIKVGSTVRMTIPSSQAYKSTGSGIIPADAPLMFIVTIHSLSNSEEV